MTFSRDFVLQFGVLPEVGPLFRSPVPAWVWSRDGGRCLWANPPGGAVLGASSMHGLFTRRWPETHPLRRAVASLARALPDQGMVARLRLADDLHSLPIACHCRSIRAPGGERGVLVIAVERAAEAPSLSALASFFSDPQADTAILDPAGGVLAEARPGAAAGIAPAMPRLDFPDAGRMLRLHFVERAREPDETAPAPPAPPALDDAGLRMEKSRLRTEQMDVGPQGESLTTPRAPAAVEPPSGHPQRESPRPAPVSPARKIPRQAVPPSPRRLGGDEAPASTKAPERSVMAGRVAQELSRKPVRFLWQTDAADRFLFVSPGLTQVVGRNADIVGERWQEAAARMQLDPSSRIARALRQRDTWSGLNAWWPIEGSNVRVPVELTALPVFGGDQSFQGYRGFGILRPAEALMPAAFEARFGPPGTPAEQIPPYEESFSTIPANVVPIRADIDRITDHSLTQQERTAFEEIAAALRDRIVGGPGEEASAPQSRATDPPKSDARENAAPALPLSAPEPPPVTNLAPPHKEEPPVPVPAPMAKGNPTNDSAGPKPSTLRAGSPPTPGAQVGDAQRRLREMTAILDTATDGVIILDAEGAIESVNGSAEALFGLDGHEMRGRHFGEFLTPASRKLALDYLSGLKDSGVASLLNEGREVEAVAGPGSIPLFMTMGRISSEAGGRFCAVLRDITHWKRIEGELLAAKLAAEEASQQKSEFLARVSHEIRTPLNAIIGFAELMSEERYGPVANERYRDYLRDIRTSGEHVVSLVNDLLDISKIEAGKLELTFAAVPLNAVVRESIGLMQPQANRARVVLRSSLSREVPAIVADERTLRQIVLNLLSNSIKFTGPGGQVITSTSLTDNGEALLRIRDTGEGMSEEELKRALEPFRQIATSTMGGPAGTGLGLPLTKALVEANRATLTIRSARGEGTVVTVTIPATRVLSE